MGSAARGTTILITDEMRALARDREPDRYLAALLSPAPARNGLLALAAFAAELKRIPQAVSDPHLAEVRLAWWRDTLLLGDGGASGNPTADAFARAVEVHDLPRETLDGLFDAFAHTFYAAAPDDVAHLRLEHELIEGALFLFALHIAGSKPDGETTVAAKSAGIAYGLARLGLEFPHALARGRLPLPLAADADRPLAHGFDQKAAKALIAATARGHLAALKPVFAAGDTGLRAPLLPLALVEPYLRALERHDHDLARDLSGVAPLTRVWRIWRAYAMGRL